MKLSLSKPSLSLPLACLALSTNALAEELPTEGAPASEAAPLAAEIPTPIAPESALPAATSGTAVTAPEAPAPPATRDDFVQRVLVHHASEEATVRIGEAAVGLASAGALFGAGFAAEGNDMSLSHSLWVGSGIAALGSLARFFIASDLEHLAAKAGEKSEEQLRREWSELADSARIERRTGAVFGTLVGTTSMVFGALVLSDEIGDLSEDNRKILGTSLLAGGGVGIAQSVVDWFVLSPTERGFALIDDAPRMQVTAAPTPGGVSVGLQGVF